MQYRYLVCYLPFPPFLCYLNFQNNFPTKLQILATWNSIPLQITSSPPLRVFNCLDDIIKQGFGLP